MELRHLRSFVAVAEERHFGRAAQRLHIAQPPLSQQIRQLERELGVQLLVRTTRRVELTAAGERYLVRAREILAQVAQAATEAGDVAAGRLGRVRMGFTGSATYELLPALSRRLRSELPGIELELTGEMLTPRQVSGLLDGSLDLGLLRPPVNAPELAVHVVRQEPLIAVLPSTHQLVAGGAATVRLLELAQDQFVTYPAQHRSVVHDAVVAACDRAGFTPDTVEVAETSTLVSFVAAGIGVALVPASVRHLAITGAVYRDLADDGASVQLAVAGRREEDDPAVLAVLALVRDSVDSETRQPHHD